MMMCGGAGAAAATDAKRATAAAPAKAAEGCMPLECAFACVCVCCVQLGWEPGGLGRVERRVALLQELARALVEATPLHTPQRAAPATVVTIFVARGAGSLHLGGVGALLLRAPRAVTRKVPKARRAHRHARMQPPRGRASYS